MSFLAFPKGLNVFHNVSFILSLLLCMLCIIKVILDWKIVNRRQRIAENLSLGLKTLGIHDVGKSMNNQKIYAIAPDELGIQ